MDYILYFMLEIWNNTQALDLTKIKVFHTYTHIRSLARHTCSLKYVFYKLRDPFFDLTVLWYPNFFLVSPFFMHSEYKKDHTYLLFFTTTVLLSFNYLKFANKNKILPFRNFDWLRKTTRILEGGVYLERLNKYLIFLLLLYLSTIEV